MRFGIKNVTAFATVAFQTGGKSAVSFAALEDCSVTPTRWDELPGEAVGTNRSFQGAGQAPAAEHPRPVGTADPAGQSRAGGEVEDPGRVSRARVLPAAGPVRPPTARSLPAPPAALLWGSALPPAKGKAPRGCLKQPRSSRKCHHKAERGETSAPPGRAFSSSFPFLCFSFRAEGNSINVGRNGLEASGASNVLLLPCL